MLKNFAKSLSGMSRTPCVPACPCGYYEHCGYSSDGTKTCYCVKMYS